MRPVKKTLWAVLPVLLVSCGSPTPRHPALSPLTAMELLRFDTKAQNRLRAIKARDPRCEFKVELPDQAANPTSIQVDHVVSCGGNNRLKEFDTSVEFTFNKTAQRWEISRFGP